MQPNPFGHLNPVATWLNGEVRRGAYNYRTCLVELPTELHFMEDLGAIKDAPSWLQDKLQVVPLHAGKLLLRDMERTGAVHVRQTPRELAQLVMHELEKQDHNSGGLWLCGLGVALTAYPNHTLHYFWEAIDKLRQKPPLLIALPAEWIDTIGPAQSTCANLHRIIIQVETTQL